MQESPSPQPGLESAANLPRNVDASHTLDEASWLRDVYDPRSPQLTARAVVTGVLLGAILSASDLYVGLKVGWVFGMGITSSILTFAVFSAIRRAFPQTAPLSMLETNTSQTVVSAAAYMSTAGLISSIPAMAMLRREGALPTPEPSGPRLVLWMLCVATLGLCVAIPLKRTLINVEKLRFPTGEACAETIRSLHASQLGAASRVRSLLLGGICAAAVKFIVESGLGPRRGVLEFLRLPGELAGRPLAAWSLRLNSSLMLYAAGSILGMRVAASLLVGALFNYALLGPWLAAHDVLRVAPAAALHDDLVWRVFRAAAESAHAIPIRNPGALHVELRSRWSVWPGTALIVAATVTTFALRWRALVAASSELLGAARSALRRSGGAGGPPGPLAETEVPLSWFVVFFGLSASGCVLMLRAWFGVPVVNGLIAVAAAFVLSVVTARSTGEAQVTPIGPMGKVTQLLFGVLMPGNLAANLMSATVTAGSAAHAADLLTEVKTGYLLGGSARKQFWAQIVGVLVGSMVCVPVYLSLATPERLGREFAVPSAQAWASVARLFRDGVSGLPKHALLAMAVAAFVGAALSSLAELLPDRRRSWLPSATGLGIAMVIDANDSAAIFIGAAAAWGLERVRQGSIARHRASVASGMIAGESLMGICLVVMRDILHWLPR